MITSSSPTYDVLHRPMRSVLAFGAIAAILCSSVSAQESVSDVFPKVRDSVVVIGTTQRELPALSGGEATSVGGIGSGVLIDPSGFILTAAHVIQVAEAIVVESTNGETIPANVVGSVPGADLALIKLVRPPTDAAPARLGDSDTAEVGDQIFVVGAPLGISHTLTVGHISARRSTNSIPGGMVEAEMFQTDAAINQGNSGGPMFNMQGEVIGIVSHMISRSGGYEGLGFVMTSNLARKLLLERRSMWSGFEGFVLSGDMARIFNLPQEGGILVQRVAEGSPADLLGLRPGSIRAEIAEEPLLLGGDVILDVLGVKVSDPDSFDQIRDRVGKLTPGSEVRVTVLRGGKRVELVAVYSAP